MKIGSLFSGYGGLEQGVQSVLGGTVAWHSEIDAGACKILAHRYPDVPNIGDITAVDWAAVEPVDVLTGGFPCQDVSAAGKRLGIRPGTRSGLWTQFAYAIDQLRPGLVVIENVRGLLSASAHSDLEPCPWCVGDDERVPLRALGAVLGDLADLGYNASWQGLRASDVGAPHGRFRVFVVAWPAADTSGLRGERRGEHGDVACPSGAGEGHGGQRERHGDAVDHRGAVAPNADQTGRGEHGRPGAVRPEQPAAQHGSDLAGDTDGSNPGRRAAPRFTREAGSQAGSTAHPASDRRNEGRPEPARLVGGPDAAISGAAAWGEFELAVRRWERCIGRPAPAPTEPSKRGGVRLSARAVEWMMGLPAGWVTDVPGLGRNEQLKALGNGVVPQQAAHALRLLLPDVAVAA